MSNFNSDLNNLFKNFQNQQKYNRYKKTLFLNEKNKSLYNDLDLNGDGKINSADKNKMINEETELKKKSNLFDVNGDGLFNQADIDMFINSDVDGDGKITQEELNFIAHYKSDMKSTFVNKKADFEFDGKRYVKGKLASGVIDGKYYKNGVLSTGIVSGKYYVKGLLANGVYSGILYKDGVAFTGIYTDNKYYKNGKVYSGTITDKKTNTTTNYKSGILQYSVTDNNGKGYPNASGNTIKFQNSKKYVTVKLAVGEKAVINKDGTVSITSKDDKTTKLYMQNGSLANNIIFNGIEYKDGIKTNNIVSICKDGNIKTTSLDGMTVI